LSVVKVTLVATGVVSQPPVATVTLSSNGLGEVISTRCYRDQAHLAAIDVATGAVMTSAHFYCGLLLLHIERYMISITE
jgi:hypothetical protein